MTAILKHQDIIRCDLSVKIPLTPKQIAEKEIIEKEKEAAEKAKAARQEWFKRTLKEVKDLETQLDEEGFRYVVLSAKKEDELAIKVSYLLKNEWRTTGGVHSHNGETWSQAMEI